MAYCSKAAQVHEHRQSTPPLPGRPAHAPVSHNRHITVPRPPDSPLVARTPVTSAEDTREGQVSRWLGA